jgi:hypothetical protein
LEFLADLNAAGKVNARDVPLLLILRKIYLCRASCLVLKETLLEFGGLPVFAGLAELGDPGHGALELEVRLEGGRLAVVLVRVRFQVLPFVVGVESLFYQLIGILFLLSLQLEVVLLRTPGHVVCLPVVVGEALVGVVSH